KDFTISAPGAINNSNQNENVIIGNGNKTITIGLTNAIRNHASNLFQSKLTFITNKGYTLSVPINVNINDNGNFVMKPTDLLFSAVKGFSEAVTKPLSISGFGVYSIEAPSWLTS